MTYTVGIDLGTTRSVIAHVPSSADMPRIIDNSEGKAVTPSAVYLTEEDDVIVGDSALEKSIMQPNRYVDEVKRHMGEDISLNLGSRENSPEEISALILQKLVQDASDRVGNEISNAVITVPAYFTDRQRTATANAAEIAGLEVERLLAEPSAAVLAYGLQKQKLGTDAQETIFVCDLGGGTFDATLVKSEYNHNYVETLSTDGNSELGGSDWTARLEDMLIDEIQQETGVDLRTESGMAEQYWRVRKAARDGKHKLSEQSATNVAVPYVVPQQGYSLDMKITREEFREETEDLLAAIEEPIDRVFQDADETISGVDTVLLIGGASRMPQLNEFIENYFGMRPSKEISPDKAVGLGAAAQASLIDDSDQTGGITLSEDGDSGGLVLVDVLPQTLGIVTVDRHNRQQFDPIIEKNTQLPAQTRSEIFGTVKYDQTSVHTEILQGESPNPSDNERLGELSLNGIPKREPSEESLAVEFRVDKDGTLTVQAEDLISGKNIETTIDSAIRSDSGEISKKQNQLPTVE